MAKRELRGQMRQEEDGSTRVSQRKYLHFVAKHLDSCNTESVFHSLSLSKKTIDVAMGGFHHRLAWTLMRLNIQNEMPFHFHFTKPRSSNWGPFDPGAIFLQFCAAVPAAVLREPLPCDGKWKAFPLESSSHMCYSGHQAWLTDIHHRHVQTIDLNTDSWTDKETSGQTKQPACHTVQTNKYLTFTQSKPFAHNRDTHPHTRMHTHISPLSDLPSPSSLSSEINACGKRRAPLWESASLPATDPVPHNNEEGRLGLARPGPAWLTWQHNAAAGRVRCQPKSCLNEIASL